MGCLLKLIFLPIWWTIRVAVFAVRAILQHTTPMRFVGYLFAIFVAVVSPAALLAALACRVGAGWYRVRARRPLRSFALVGLYAAAILLLLVGILAWARAQVAPHWVLSAWGGQAVFAVLVGFWLRVLGDPQAWYYLGLLFAPRRFLETWGVGLLVGPAVYVVLASVFFRLPGLERQLRDQSLREARWERAVQPRVQSRALRRALKRARGHPLGAVRWGWDQVNDWAYDIDPVDLSRHVALFGVTGSGKTTAIARLAEGLLGQDWAVVFLDCKGGGLRATAQRLAAAAHARYRLVDPAFPERTLHYNPCTGSPADISNKFIGAFSFGNDGEVYKQVSQLALGLVSAALQALGRPVTIESLGSALTIQAIRGLVGELAGLDSADGNHLSRLLKDAVDAGRVQSEALETLRARLANFQRSHFAPILEEPTKDNTFDIDDALSAGVSYLSLPATAASEDVPLMGRILLQDLKQAVARREHAIGGFARRLPAAVAMAVASARVPNVLLVIDEFAALQDPGQLQDLLLQARSAGVTLALSSQLLPQDPALAAAVKGVGMVASLRVGDIDAQQVADLFGTYEALEVTEQTGELGGHSTRTGTGSVRRVQRYIAHPNEIKRLPDASAMVKIDRAGGWGREVTVIRFWPAQADWPAPTPPAAQYATVPSSPAGPGSGPRSTPELLPPENDLPWLPDPPGLASTS